MCPAGSFLDPADDYACKQCEADTYSDSDNVTQCTACPTGQTTAGPGATSADNCG